MATTPLPSRGPRRGRNYYVTCASSGVPNRGDKIRSGYLTPAFSGAHKKAELLRNPCVLGGPRQRSQNHKWLCNPCVLGGPLDDGTKSEVPTPPMPSRGPGRGHDCYANLASRGAPTPSPGTKSEVPTPPMPSRGPRGGRDCYANLAFKGGPNAKPGDKIRSAYLTLAFLGAHRRAQLQRNPCLLAPPPPRKRGQIRSGTTPLPSLGGPQEGAIAT